MIELVTYADLKALLKLELPAITDYPDLNVIRDAVTVAIEEFTGRSLTFEPKTQIIFIGSTPTDMIYLPGIPIVSVESVTFRQRGVDSDITNYDETGYGIRLLSKIINTKITVEYTGGLTDSQVTGPLHRAALYQTGYEFQADDQIGAESVSTDGGFVSRPELKLLDNVKKTLTTSMHPLRR
jgi:hypothetical protein